MGAFSNIVDAVESDEHETILPISRFTGKSAKSTIKTRIEASIKTMIKNEKRQANFLITIQTLHLLKKQVPNKKQSEFVEEILFKALKKNAFRKAIRSSMRAWKNHKEDTEKFIRSLRENKRI
jgi:hypothetical protein